MEPDTVPADLDGIAIDYARHALDRLRTNRRRSEQQRQEQNRSKQRDIRIWLLKWRPTPHAFSHASKIRSSGEAETDSALRTGLANYHC